MILLQIQAVFPSFDLNSDAVRVWTSFLMEADAEMAAQNLKEHIKGSKFAPTIHDIVKPNEHILAERDKERTRTMLLEQQKLLEHIAPPPWEREGLTHREWLHRELAKNRGKRDA